MGKPASKFSPLYFWLIVLTSLLSGCGGLGDSDAIGLHPFAGAQIQSGTLSVYKFNDGIVGDKIGATSFTEITDNSPAIDMTFYRGPVYVELTNATYNDPFDGTTVTFGSDDHWTTVFDYQGEIVNINVNPITTIAATYTSYLIKVQHYSVKAAMIRANVEVGDHFGGIDIINTTPSSLQNKANTVTDEVFYGATLYGLGSLAHLYGENLLTFSHALTTDMKDGYLDGGFYSENVYPSTLPFSTDLLTNSLTSAINVVLSDNQLNKTGLAIGSFDVYLNSLSPTSSFYDSIIYIGNDATAPTINYLNHEETLESHFLSGVIPLHITANDDLSGVADVLVTVAGTDIIDLDPSASSFVGNFDTTAFSDGSKSVIIRARDIAGNENKQTLFWRIDNQLPQIHVYANGNEIDTGAYVGGLFTLKVETLYETSLVDLQVASDNANVNAALIDTIPANESIFEADLDTMALLGTSADLTLTINATDDAGNLSNRQLLLHINNHGPTIQIVTPTLFYIEGDVPIEINTGGQFPVTQLTLKFIGTAPNNYTHTIDNQNGSNITHYVTNTNTTTLAEGPALLEVTARDTFGLVSSISQPVNINNTYYNSETSVAATFPALLSTLGTGPVIKAGDFNNDGIKDLALMSYYAGTSGGSGAQTFATIWGGNNILSSITPNLLANQLSTNLIKPFNFYYTEHDTAPDVFYNRNVDRQDGVIALCDFDHDGYQDMAVGRPFTRVGGGGLSEGAVTVHYGPQNNNGDFAQIAELTLAGSTNLGIRVSCGDLNTDSFDDLIIDSEYRLDNQQNHVYTIYGSSNRALMTMTGPNTKDRTYAMNQPSNPTTNQWLLNMKVVGDVDGDSYNDAVVNDGYKTFRIIYGPIEILTVINSGNVSNPFYLGDNSGNLSINNLVGGWMRPIGDLNGDGKIDIAMEKPLDNALNGRAFISYSTGNRLTPFVTATSFELSAPSVSDEFGNNIHVGDANGDGIKDLFVSTHDASKDYILIYKGPNYNAMSPMVYNNAFTINGSCGQEFEVTDLDNDQRTDLLLICNNVPDKGSTYRDTLIIKDNL